MAEYTLHADGDNKALRDAIFKATPKAVEQMKTMSQKFKGTTDIDTCKNIWNFLKTNIRYVADGNHQKVKLPSALLREKVGDCKSYSLFTAAILQNLNIPWHYVLSSYTNDPTPQHIYVVCDSGIIVDAVWIAFNQEKKPNFRYKHKVNNNDMRISYIAGIPAKRKTIFGCSPNCRCTPCRTRVGTNGIRGTSTMMAGNSKMLGTESKFMGIGRTGIDWLKAATGREASFGESTEYFIKNRSLSPARFLIIEFIEQNGGGIANFLYNAWLRTDDFLLPNQKRYEAEYAEISNKLKANFSLLDKEFAFTKEEKALLGASLVSNQGGPAQALDFTKFGKETTNKVAMPVTIQQALSPARYKLYTDYMAAQKLQKEAYLAQLKPLSDALDLKYPRKSRIIPPANDNSKKKYRDIELMWFWKLGGSPDDFNNAVKEGNTKSPRGKDANYMLNKALNGNLGLKDIGLIIRGFTSAFAGDKFGLGDDGTFALTISGMNRKGGITGDPVTVSTIVTSYVVPIAEGLVSLMAILAPLGVFGKAEETGGGEGGGGNEGGNGGQGGGGGEDEGGDNTKMLIILGAVAVGGFLLLNK
jgi:hypothetical protein